MLRAAQESNEQQSYESLETVERGYPPWYPLPCVYRLYRLYPVHHKTLPGISVQVPVSVLLDFLPLVVMASVLAC